jgi:hypothetical protein
MKLYSAPGSALFKLHLRADVYVRPSIGGRGSSVGTETGYGLDNTGTTVRDPLVGTYIFMSTHTPNQRLRRPFTSGVKRREHEANVITSN